GGRGGGARGGAGEGGGGRYVLQAAMAAVHAQALTADQTDWRGIVRLYDTLAQVTPSPIVDLNRAVAVSMAEGPAAGLAQVDGLAKSPALRGYYLLPAVRGDLLAKLGPNAEARAQVQGPASRPRNERERRILFDRAAACAHAAPEARAAPEV